MATAFLLTFCPGCKKTIISQDNFTNDNVHYHPGHDDILYHGRVDYTDTLAPKFFWAGSGFSIWFEGKSVEVQLDDASGNNFYNAILDDNYNEKMVFDCKKGDSVYIAAESVPAGIHKQKRELFSRFAGSAGYDEKTDTYYGTFGNIVFQKGAPVTGRQIEVGSDGTLLFDARLTSLKTVEMFFRGEKINLNDVVNESK